MDYQEFVEDIIKYVKKFVEYSTVVLVSLFFGYLFGWARGVNSERNMIVEEINICKANNGQYVLESGAGNSYCDVNGLKVKSFSNTTSPNK